MKNFLRAFALLALFFSTINVINAQCDINSGCAFEPTLTIDPPVFDAANFSIFLDNIEFGGFECISTQYQSGIAIYIYQLLPDGTRMTQCAVVNEPPYNVVGSIAFGFGQTSFCEAIVPIGSLSIGPDQGFEACDGAYLEVEAVLFVTEDTSFDPATTSAFSELSDSEYYVVNLGNIEININNEFPGQGQPLTTAKIRDFNSDSEGPMTLACGDNVELYLEGLSRIANCIPYGDISTGISSELTNEFYYSINGEEPVMVLNPSTGAAGGQLTGPDPNLGNLCYAGVLSSENAYVLEFSELPADLCDGSNIEFTLRTSDLFTNVTVEDKFTVIYTGGSGCGVTCAVDPHCDSPCYVEYNPSPDAGSAADAAECVTVLDCETIAANGLESTCNSIANCTPSSCPTVYLNDDNLPSLPNALCVGDLLELCFDMAVDEAMFNANSIEFNYELLLAGNPASVTLTNSYSSGTAIDVNATGQICFSATIPASTNSCEAYELSLEIGSVFYRDPNCADDFVAYDLLLTSPLPLDQTGDNLNDLIPLLGIAGLNPILVQVYPTPDWTASVNQLPACDGSTLGIVEINAADGTLCDTTTDLGAAGIDGECPSNNGEFPEFTYTAFETFIVPDQNEMDSVVVNPCAISITVPAQAIECAGPMEPSEGCDDGDCSNGLETWDGCECIAGTAPVDPGCDDGECSNGIETWDGCECVDGIAPVDPGCDDGDCTNGVETWDGCECIAGTAPIDPGCDDGDCTNGVETWDGCECLAGTAPVDPGCDDGDCSNGLETYNEATCSCDSGTAPLDPGCDDSDCTNGLETWDGCECIAGEAPVDTGCDDGDCSNGVETWDGCECVAGEAPVDPGCDDGDCSNGVETWNGCECVAGVAGEIPMCDDGDCSNGVETYDAANCECVAGEAPVDPGCDDMDCTNGTEIWDGCECVVIAAPIDPGCDDGDCSNGVETWDGCQCVVGEAPVDPGCDDGDCSNGVETWNGCECVAGVAGEIPVCDDGDCSNGVETYDAANCECVAGETPIDPGCDDGDCSNGVETWNGCECVAGTPGETPNCDDGNCANGLETYNEATCSCDPGTPPDDTCPEDTDCDTITGWDTTTCMCVTVIIDRALCDDDDDCTLDIFDETTCQCVFETIVNCGMVFGCTNNCATNYDPDANEDDGSCMLPNPDDGCEFTTDTFDETNCVVVNTPNCEAGTLFNADTCTCADPAPQVGCTNPCATNYNPDANVDDGSCSFPNTDDGCDLTVDAIDDITCEITNTPNCPEGTNFNAADCICENNECTPPQIGVFDCE